MVSKGSMEADSHEVDRKTTVFGTTKKVQGVPDIKVITGIRRCGKSKLMDAFIEYIKDTDADANIIYIDFTNLQFGELKEYHKPNDYLFIDEVQLCEGFEKTLNSLHSSEKCDIYVTGPNAFLLSSDLATGITIPLGKIGGYAQSTCQIKLILWVN